MSPRPRPVPDSVSAFYWEHAAREQLAVLRCAACDRRHHPPEVACPHCGGLDLDPEVVSGDGTVFASTVVRQAFDQAFRDEVPFVLAMVALAEQPDVRVLGNVLDVPAEPVPVGTPVRVVFEPHDDWTLPQFRLAEA